MALTEAEVKLEIWKVLVNLKVDNPPSAAMQAGFGYTTTRHVLPDPVIAAHKAKEVFEAMKLPKTSLRRK